ncbi:hypothetical protein XA39_10105 [Acinetobacter tandoii]|nr:hypothetical protein XA39_10105 [Acinetobacter tandoii]
MLVLLICIINVLAYQSVIASLLIQAYSNIQLLSWLKYHLCFKKFAKILANFDYYNEFWKTL